MPFFLKLSKVNLEFISLEFIVDFKQNLLYFISVSHSKFVFALDVHCAGCLLLLTANVS